MHVSSWQEAYRGLLPQEYLESLSVQGRTETWERNLSQPTALGAVTLVAELDDRIIGFASIGPSRDDDMGPDTGELWGLYLHPDHWGAGHGRTLHARAVTALSSTGATTATLWVLSGNQRARRFYEQQGWVADGAEKTDWRGDVRLDEVRYRCTLPTGREAGSGEPVVR